MILCVSTMMKENEKEVVNALLMQGFNDCAEEAKTTVTGGQTIFNPWPIIGGIGISAVQKSEFIMPNGAEKGDTLVLTKLLGTQVACNVYQWLSSIPEKWEQI